MNRDLLSVPKGLCKKALQKLPFWMVQILGLDALVDERQSRTNEPNLSIEGKKNLQLEAQKLYNRLSPTLSSGAGLIIEFISCNPKEGTSTLAREFALAARQQTNEPVLLLSLCSNWITPSKEQMDSGDLASCESPLAADTFGHDFPPLLRTKDCGTIHPRLRFCHEGETGLILGGIDPDFEGTAIICNRPDFWAALRKQVILTVVDAPPYSSCYDGITISQSMDAVIPIVEAEKTRAPVLKNLLNELEAHEAPVAGVILNKRRFFIPKIVYRWLEQF